MPFPALTTLPDGGILKEKGGCRLHGAAAEEGYFHEKI